MEVGSAFFVIVHKIILSLVHRLLLGLITVSWTTIINNDVSKIKDPLAGIGRQASKLLEAQKTGHFPKETPSLMARSEIERLLREPAAEQLWIKEALRLQLPHAKYPIHPDEITSTFLGGAILASTKKHYIPLVCNLAADALTAHPEVAGQQNPDQLRNNLDAVIALYESNQLFKEVLHSFINAKYFDSYVAKSKYGPGLASLVVRGEDILALIASLDPNASTDGILQFESIVHVQKAMPDPRHFSESIIAAAAKQGLVISMHDVMSVAYILYQKRFEYMQAALDLRQRIGLITGSERVLSDIEQAIATTEFSSHQKNILLYGKVKIELAIKEAGRLGLELEQTVYIDPPQQSRREARITSFLPSSQHDRFIVEVTTDGAICYLDLYVLKRLQVKSI